MLSQNCAIKKWAILVQEIKTFFESYSLSETLVVM